MDTNQVSENLQVIRTLMERSALYRRALAPIMIFAGLAGIAAAVAGCVLKIESAPGFVGYWMGVALFGVAGAFLLVRRQAIKSAEPFWSPPARRVAQALTPSLTAGFLIGVLVFIVWSKTGMDADADAGTLIWLPALWALFYGCAMHAAGFFTPRGLRVFGWMFIAAGVAILFWLLLLGRQEEPDVSWKQTHWLMGGLFGFLQLAYGTYLYLTGAERNRL